ncbi:CD276 antigen homolog isoform X2 [Cyclopterus lumpus]|uniref:CD276 antigen homolog isoform X2 n=1 Tax=Cyclopterus lumpus TaxID=8103 RepID=UPI00148601C2|nr:CD276 antigen homolog isoform X2 [Cyclopterus lumpus]
MFQSLSSLAPSGDTKGEKMTCRMLLLFILLLFILTSCVCGDASRDTSVEVWASVGDTVILPCQLDLAGENDPSVEWSKNMSIAFRYRAGCETFEEKDPVFSYRTSLFMEELKDGNVSLRLSDVRLSDAGTYKCRKWRAPQDTIVLFVGAVSEPKLSLVQGVAVTVQCEAACWSPLPVVTFQDAQGNDVGAEEPKHVFDSKSGCTSVTRRATVKNGNRLTCRVHQSETNQTRLTEIYIPEECFTSWIPWICFLVLLVLIEGVIIAFQCRKRCKSEGEHKSLSTQSSHRNSTSSNGQNPRSQADPVQNGTAELQGEVDELKSSLCVRDETLRRLREELRSKQSPVEWRLGQPSHRNPSESSQDVSNPTNLGPEPLPRDVDPKPAAATDGNRPNSGNFTQNKDSEISKPIPLPGKNNSAPDLLKYSGAVSPAAAPALPAEGVRVNRSRSVSEGAKPKNNYLTWSGNRFSPLANVSEDESEQLLK